MPNTLPCSLCQKANVTNDNVVIRKTPVHFHCNNHHCTSKDQWHMECIRNNMCELNQITIRCRHCKNDTTIKQKPWLISYALQFSWIRYPTKVPFAFVVNRLLDIFACAIGMSVLILLYATQPHTESKWTDDVRQSIIHREVPAQTERLAFQLTNSANPQLAVATMGAMWILGWMSLSIIINLIYYPIHKLVGKKLQQIGNFIVE